jgi:hypothetical protein
MISAMNIRLTPNFIPAFAGRAGQGLPKNPLTSTAVLERAQ